jgi:hypothetical protein
MDTYCLTDPRRDAVRAASGRNGLDYVEVGDDPTTLHAYFLGRLPPELRVDAPDLPRLLAISSGDAITGLKIIDADPVHAGDSEHDDYLVLHLDREGDRSRYTLNLIGIEGVDPHYASADFSFHIDCASGLDCQPARDCDPPLLDEPRPNYLAKDYAALRQLILDRFALLMPDWQERHVPDLGLTLVELLAYVGDYLSYYQDAVGTEAYLGTARQRISVRRHVRLVDYHLHEGCNARAWVHVGVDVDTPALPWAQIAFITPWRDPLLPTGRLLGPAQLEGLAPSSYEWFEPLVADAAQTVVFRAAHTRIAFYAWGRRSCCLPAGTTRATLLDHWLPNSQRALNLQPGDVLVLAEVRGARTGEPADADPSRRWAVRLTKVEADEDPIYPVQVNDDPDRESARRATPVLNISWTAEDALPFSLCLSAIGLAPACAYLQDVSVAWGNIVLVDHGRSLAPEPLGPVPSVSGEACCDCVGQPADVQVQPARFSPTLANVPLTHAEAVPAPLRPASQSLLQDPRAALPALTLVEVHGEGEKEPVWTSVNDLLQSGPDDRQVVAEIDNEGLAHLRFGDGELGRQPDADLTLNACYRVGLGAAGNVGAAAIACIVISGQMLDGVQFDICNPLPAEGGTPPEPIAQARLHAPLAFRRELLRAITADDYTAIAARNPALQGAHAALVWTGSWFEADVALDPWRRAEADPALAASVQAALYRVRRMGHDLRVQPAVHVPLLVGLSVCGLPGYDHGHLKAALLKRFLGNGGYFDQDQLSFGQSVFLSRIVAAAMTVPGVMCATVMQFQRYGRAANGEIESGVLALLANEIAELANDPDHPDRGLLNIDVEGGLQ